VRHKQVHSVHELPVRHPFHVLEREAPPRQREALAHHALAPVKRRDGRRHLRDNGRDDSREDIVDSGIVQAAHGAEVVAHEALMQGQRFLQEQMPGRRDAGGLGPLLQRSEEVLLIELALHVVTVDADTAGGGAAVVPEQAQVRSEIVALAAAELIQEDAREAGRVRRRLIGECCGDGGAKVLRKTLRILVVREVDELADGLGVHQVGYLVPPESVAVRVPRQVLEIDGNVESARRKLGLEHAHAERLRNVLSRPQ